MITVNIDVKDVMDDLSDGDLLDEVQRRKLSIPNQSGHGQLSTTDIARDALWHLIGHRRDQALASLQDLIASYVPREVLDAYELAQADKLSSAICALDRFIEPGPSATATMLNRPLVSSALDEATP